MLILFVAAVLILGASGQVLVQGPCPDVQIIDDFNVTRYLGLWQEIARFHRLYQNGNCTTANYGPINEDGTIKVINSEITDGEEGSIEGVLIIPDNSTFEGKLKLDFNVSNIDVESNYWILGTDYENYSLVWSCFEVGNLFNLQSAWILGRTKPLSVEVSDTVNRLVVSNHINADHFQTHDSPECATYP